MRSEARLSFIYFLNLFLIFIMIQHKKNQPKHTFSINPTFDRFPPERLLVDRNSAAWMSMWLGMTISGKSLPWGLLSYLQIQKMLWIVGFLMANEEIIQKKKRRHCHLNVWLSGNKIREKIGIKDSNKLLQQYFAMLPSPHLKPGLLVQP